MKTVRWSIPLAIFVVLVAFLWVGLGRDPREVPSPLIGKAAPSFALAQLHGDKPLSTADLKAKVWLLHVWAAWESRDRPGLRPRLQGQARRRSGVAREKWRSVHRVGRRPGWPRRHRLRRLRRAGDFCHRSIGHRPL